MLENNNANVKWVIRKIFKLENVSLVLTIKENAIAVVLLTHKRMSKHLPVMRKVFRILHPFLPLFFVAQF